MKKIFFYLLFVSACVTSCTKNGDAGLVMDGNGKAKAAPSEQSSHDLAEKLQKLTKAHDPE